MEIGWVTGFKDAAYPVKYDIGGYFDTSDFTRPNGTVGNGRQAFWAQGEQTIWRPDRATNQSLRAFAGAIIYSGNEDFWGQYYAGLYDYAPFGKLRPADTIGLVGTLYKDNRGYLPNGASNWQPVDLRTELRSTGHPGDHVQAVRTTCGRSGQSCRRDEQRRIAQPA